MLELLLEGERGMVLMDSTKQLSIKKNCFDEKSCTHLRFESLSGVESGSHSMSQGLDFSKYKNHAFLSLLIASQRHL
jgi:hypothetical protein